MAVSECINIQESMARENEPYLKKAQSASDVNAVTCIYVITHAASGKRYVGQSRNLWARLASHRLAKSETLISRSVKKYGWEAFSVEIACLCRHDELDQKERALIRELNTVHPFGFNLNGGGGSAGILSEASREKISRALKGRKASDETKRRMSESNTGKTHSQEAKRKMSSSHTGKKRSKEAREAMSTAQLQRWENYRKSGEKVTRDRSDEYRKKISEANRRRWESFRRQKAAGQGELNASSQVVEPQ